MRPRDLPQQRPELRELIPALGERLGAFPRFAPVEFGAVVGCDAVDYEEPDVVLGDGDGDLVAQDVLLGFDIVDVRALDCGEGGPVGEEGWVVLEDLGEPGCLEGGFGGDVEGWFSEAVGWRELDGEQEGQEELGFADGAGGVSVGAFAKK